MNTLKQHKNKPVLTEQLLSRPSLTEVVWAQSLVPMYFHESKLTYIQCMQCAQLLLRSSNLDLSVIIKKQKQIIFQIGKHILQICTHNWMALVKQFQHWTLIWATAIQCITSHHISTTITLTSFLPSTSKSPKHNLPPSRFSQTAHDSYLQMHALSPTHSILHNLSTIIKIIKKPSPVPFYLTSQHNTKTFHHIECLPFPHTRNFSV